MKKKSAQWDTIIFSPTWLEVAKWFCRQTFTVSLQSFYMIHVCVCAPGWCDVISMRTNLRKMNCEFFYYISVLSCSIWPFLEICYVLIIIIILLLFIKSVSIQQTGHTWGMTRLIWIVHVNMSLDRFIRNRTRSMPFYVTCTTLYSSQYVVA